MDDLLFGALAVGQMVAAATMYNMMTTSARRFENVSQALRDILVVQKIQRKQITRLTRTEYDND